MSDWPGRDTARRRPMEAARSAGGRRGHGAGLGGSAATGARGPASGRQPTGDARVGCRDATCPGFQAASRAATGDWGKSGVLLPGGPRWCAPVRLITGWVRLTGPARREKKIPNLFIQFPINSEVE
jgi:hypothetical protein